MESLPTLALLAGGLATRLRPITEKIPKVLVEVAGRPFVTHQLDLLRQNDVTDIVICAGRLGEIVQEAVGDGREFGARIRYSFDGDQLLGTGGALRKALPLLGPEFYVLYGDAYLECDYRDVYRAFRAANRPGLMTVFRNDDRWDRSNIVFEDGRIAHYDKRNRTPDMRHIDYGLSLLRREVFSAIPNETTVDLADVYAGLVARGEMVGYEVTRRFYEIGSLEGLEETRRYLARRKTT